MMDTVVTGLHQFCKIKNINCFVFRLFNFFILSRESDDRYFVYELNKYVRHFRVFPIDSLNFSQLICCLCCSKPSTRENLCKAPYPNATAPYPNATTRDKPRLCDHDHGCRKNGALTLSLRCRIPLKNIFL